MTQIELSFLPNFTRFHRNNPMIFNEIVKFADKQRLKRHHYSIEIILNVVRFHTDLSGKGDPFKINNNYKPYYARMYMEYRDCKGFFQLRGSLADDYDFKPEIEHYQEWQKEFGANVASM